MRMKHGAARLAMCVCVALLAGCVSTPPPPASRPTASATAEFIALPSATPAATAAPTTAATLAAAASHTKTPLPTPLPTATPMPSPTATPPLALTTASLPAATRPVAGETRIPTATDTRAPVTTPRPATSRATRQPVQLLAELGTGADDLAFSPDGGWLAVGSARYGDETKYAVEVWDVASRRLRWSGQQADMVRKVAFGPDGTRWVAPASTARGGCGMR